MRMLALVSEAFGAGGGVAQYNRDFIGAAAAAQSTIAVLARSAESGAQAGAPNIHLHKPRSSKISYALDAIRLALSQRPDVVFCGHLYMAPLGRLVARMTGARLIVQLHGIEVWQRPSRWIRQAVEATDLVLCVSRDTRSRLLSWADIPPERAVVLANTVSEAFTPGDGAAMRGKLAVGDAKVLLSVGRLDRREQYKGQDRVIAAMPGLLASGLDVIYLIAGDGDDQPRLEQLATTCEGRVRFLGRVSGGDLPDLYRAADLFVLPSTGEGFGIVFLEAMACGTPALGLAVGGAVDALGEMGLAATEGELASTLERQLTALPDAPSVLSARITNRFGRKAFTDRVAELLTRLQSAHAR